MQEAQRLCATLSGSLLQLDGIKPQKEGEKAIAPVPFFGEPERVAAQGTLADFEQISGNPSVEWSLHATNYVAPESKPQTASSASTAVAVLEIGM
jgi:hypothetical protein